MTDDDPKSKRQQDRELDEELDDSFPASDPPSSSSPGGGVGAPDHDVKKRRSGDRPADPGRLRRGSGGMPIRDD